MLTVWLILAVYLIGLVFSVRPLAEASLENMLLRMEAERELDKRLYPRTWEVLHIVGEIRPTASGRRSAAWAGLGKALVWPLTLPIHLLAPRVVAPSERARAERAELEKLRKLARDHDLPMPEES